MNTMSNEKDELEILRCCGVDLVWNTLLGHYQCPNCGAIYYYSAGKLIPQQTPKGG